MNNIHSLLH